MSLAQVMELGNKVGMSLQMANRDPQAEIVLPAVVHWKAGDFAALLKEVDGRILAQDPTFGDELWVTRKALQEEGSGFFLQTEVEAYLIGQDLKWADGRAKSEAISADLRERLIRAREEIQPQPHS
jgi:hypothetical protein